MGREISENNGVKDSNLTIFSRFYLTIKQGQLHIAPAFFT
ncbi:hypothetical protein ENHYD8BJ_130101 [Enhydrobacter sp. 8BJ]|nr:hypothetical protein ENHYD8BJ_130101 [Enhydrobacter sp. 8BJ]